MMEKHFFQNLDCRAHFSDSWLAGCKHIIVAESLASWVGSRSLQPHLWDECENQSNLAPSSLLATVWTNLPKGSVGHSEDQGKQQDCAWGSGVTWNDLLQSSPLPQPLSRSWTTHTVCGSSIAALGGSGETKEQRAIQDSPRTPEQTLPEALRPPPGTDPNRGWAVLLPEVSILE